MATTCEILDPNTHNLSRCCALLRSGEVVGVPTETVYGLAGNALSADSARRIFSVKGRPLIDPLIVHFPSSEAALQHIEAPDGFAELTQRFWPGPLTLVVNKQDSIPDIVTAGLNSVAIRVPRHPVFRSLLEQVDFPLAAPSANPFGYVSPTQAGHVQTTLGDRIPAVLDGGESQHGLESTILDLRNPEKPKILRYGPVLKSEIEAVLLQSSQSTSDLKVAAIFQTKPRQVRDPHHYWFSEGGDLKEIAHNLFALIQRLDHMDYQQIWIAKANNTGIGEAINDRLGRAATKFKATE
jgi:L-threonylcarbamoyladenylate synthase